MNTSHETTYQAVTPQRWADVQRLFQGHGYLRSCWCMWWRMGSKQFNESSADSKRDALKALVDAHTPVGVIGYRDGEPVGWCSVAPRETYARLERSPKLKRLDDAPVWSVVCFWINPEVRGQGLMADLLRAGVEYAFSQGAQVVEGYPIEPVKDANGKVPPMADWYMGSLNAFLSAGFRVANISSKGRKTVRIEKNDRL